MPCLRLNTSLGYPEVCIQEFLFFSWLFELCFTCQWLSFCHMTLQWSEDRSHHFWMRKKCEPWVLRVTWLIRGGPSLEVSLLVSLAGAPVSSGLSLDPLLWPLSLAFLTSRSVATQPTGDLLSVFTGLVHSRSVLSIIVSSGSSIDTLGKYWWRELMGIVIPVAC